MKTIYLATVMSFALALAGCNKQERADATAKVKEAAHETQVAISDAWNDAKEFTFARRDDFNAKAKYLSAQTEVQLSELRANYAEAQASASRKAAMEELKNSEADYKAKLDALGHATADTWDEAKNNVILAWDKLQASYRKARST